MDVTKDSLPEYMAEEPATTAADSKENGRQQTSGTVTVTRARTIASAKRVFLHLQANELVRNTQSIQKPASKYNTPSKESNSGAQSTQIKFQSKPETQPTGKPSADVVVLYGSQTDTCKALGGNLQGVG